MGILGPGSVCSPRALLMRRIIINGYLLDSRIPFHIEVVKLGIGKDSKIIFKSEALVIRLHFLWGMYRVQVCNVLGYIGCPTTTIKARHIPDYGIRSGREYQPTVLGEYRVQDLDGSQEKMANGRGQGAQAIEGCAQVRL